MSINIVFILHNWYFWHFEGQSDWKAIHTGASPNGSLFKVWSLIWLPELWPPWCYFEDWNHEMTMKTTVIMIMTLLLKTIRNGRQMVFVEDFVIILINWRWWSRYNQGWKSNGIPWRLCDHNHDHADEMMVMITISSGLEMLFWEYEIATLAD